MKFLFPVVVVSLLLVGCSDNGGGGGDGDAIFGGNSDGSVSGSGSGSEDDVTVPGDSVVNDGINIPSLSNIPSEEYIDSTIRLDYPSTWLVNPNGQIAGLNTQFTDSETNSLNGVDNCGFIYLFDPTVSLLDTVEQTLGSLDSSPEPRIEFPEVNGVAASKITGSVTVLNTQVPAVIQTLVSGGQLVTGICIGSSSEEFELILGSVTIN